MAFRPQVGRSLRRQALHDMTRLDKITAIFLFILSALIIWETSKMELYAEFGPGYGFLPFWLGVLLAILSIVLYVEAWRRPAADDAASPFPPRPALQVVTIALVLVAVFAFVLEIVGYLVDTLAFTFIMLTVVEKETWRHAAIFSVAFTVALYVLFQLWLGIRLPKNMFGF